MQKGDTFRQEYTVGEKQYAGFIDIFGDNNPLHTDHDFALAHGMSQKVMHGNILNGFVSHFIGECLPVKNVMIHSQAITYSKPVFLHDTLKFESEISEYSEAVKAFVFKFSFRNSSGARVARGTVQIGLI